MCLLQVQFMDRLLADKEGRELLQLIDNPKQWLAPVKESINRDPKIASLIKEVAFAYPDSKGPNDYIMYCNPVDENTEPYEEFTFSIEGTQCTEITRRALCPW